MQISTYGQSQGTLTGHIFSADERVDVRVGERTKKRNQSPSSKVLMSNALRLSIYKNGRRHNRAAVTGIKKANQRQQQHRHRQHQQLSARSNPRAKPQRMCRGSEHIALQLLPAGIPDVVQIVSRHNHHLNVHPHHITTTHITTSHITNCFTVYSELSSLKVGSCLIMAPWSVYK